MLPLHEIYQQAVDLWQQVSPVYKGITAAISGLTVAAIKYKNTQKWFVEKWDRKVLRILSESQRTARVNMRPGQTALFLPFPFQEIVREARRSEKSVYRTLRRLEDRGEVHEVKNGWNLGPRPEALTLSNLEYRMTMPSRWGGNRLNRGTY